MLGCLSACTHLFNPRQVVPPTYPAAANLSHLPSIPCWFPVKQVYISYGPKGNSDLLLLYGFSLDRNPYNSVDVTISLDEVKTPSGSQ